jgi:hypothetical protein
MTHFFFFGEGDRWSSRSWSRKFIWEWMRRGRKEKKVIDIYILEREWRRLMGDVSALDFKSPYRHAKHNLSVWWWSKQMSTWAVESMLLSREIEREKRRTEDCNWGWPTRHCCKNKRREHMCWGNSIRCRLDNLSSRDNGLLVKTV